ncbi:MAG: 5-formyltetrahydrofolate cyclo-ligase [Actinomycetota bacterium]
METTVRKATIRRLVLSRRGRLDPADRAVRGAALIERLMALPEVAEADPVLAFVSISSEVPTAMLLDAVLRAGKRLLLPYVADDGALRAAAISSLDELEPGFRGIPEPRARLPIAPDTAGVIVVPGVAFDESGNRLGYGGGFYDVFLRAAGRVPRVGICFEVQVVDHIPHEDHDEPVDIVVTEQRVFRRARL